MDREIETLGLLGSNDGAKDIDVDMGDEVTSGQRPQKSPHDGEKDDDLALELKGQNLDTTSDTSGIDIKKEDMPGDRPKRSPIDDEKKEEIILETKRRKPGKVANTLDIDVTMEDLETPARKKKRLSTPGNCSATCHDTH
jgi:hypothetical protein